MSQNILDLKRRFLEYLEIEKGRSLKTVENYDRYITRFLNFAKVTSPSDINQDKVREFRLHLNRQENYKKENLKKNTQNYHLIALRSFLKHMSKNDIETLAPEKIELAKTEMRELDLISKSEFERMMDFSKDKNSGSISSLKEKAILELLFSTGLRVSELCSLDQDLDLEAEEFTIRGKGGKVRLVFMSNEARSAIKNYLNKRHSDKNQKLNDALFISSTGNRLNPRAVQRIIKKRSVAAGITKKVTPHTIRHYFATNLLQNGADIRSVQMMLGHSSINTTQVYTNISDKYLKEVHKKFHAK